MEKPFIYRRKKYNKKTKLVYKVKGSIYQGNPKKYY